MPKKNYPFFQTLTHKIAATRLGAKYSIPTQHHLDRFVFKLSGGRTTLSALLTGLPIAIISTIGAKSGLARSTPVLYVSDEQAPNAVVIVGSNYGQAHNPAWYYNLKAH